MKSKEEKIAEALKCDAVVETIAHALKVGCPVELKLEKNRLVVVSIERHARTKIELVD